MAHAGKSAQTDQNLAQLARAALQKQQRGQKPNRQERAALERVQRDNEERDRWVYYRTIPKKHWVEMSGRQHKVLADQARTYGIPVGEKSIDLPAVVRWVHEMLAEHGRKILAGDPQQEIWEGDAASPALERLREVQYEIKRRELARLDGTLADTELVRRGFSQVAGILRSMGERLERDYGPDALDLLNDTLADCDRVIEGMFQEAAGPETQPEGEETGAQPQN